MSANGSSNNMLWCDEERFVRDEEHVQSGGYERLHVSGGGGESWTTASVSINIWTKITVSYIPSRRKT